jgi:hypothetical protein
MVLEPERPEIGVQGARLVERLNTIEHVDVTTRATKKLTVVVEHPSLVHATLASC